MVPVRCDVADEADREALVDAALDLTGRIDVLVNAGASTARGTIIDTTPETFDALFSTNVRGPYFLMQAAIRLMIAKGTEGAICTIGSISALAGQPFINAYCASKGGLIRYLESLRAECRGSAVTVHTVSPGYLRTALTAGNRFAMPGLLEPDGAARALLVGVAAGREHIVLPRRIGWLSAALGLLPARWHDALLRGQPRKPRAGEEGATDIPGLTPPPR